MSHKSNEALKTIMLVKRWGHHTKSGGYSRLRTEIPHSKIIQPRAYSNYFLKKNGRRIINRVLPSARHINLYNIGDLIAELNVFYEASRRQYSLIHSLYAEDQLNILLTYKKRLRTALIGTFHLPPESNYMRRVLKADKVQRFRNLDGAIAVSRSLATFYEDWIGKGKVTYIPLGVDIDAFTPDLNLKSQTDTTPLHVLIVGSHGRDWSVIDKVMKAVKENDIPIRFTAVIRPSLRKRFDEHPEVQLFSDISEPELIALYRKSDVLLMPVTFATANNSLLESLACGTPVISTNTGGIPDYLNNHSGWLMPNGDAYAIYNLLTELTFSRSLIREKKEAARQWAINFSWENVANRISEFYKEVASRSNTFDNG